MSKKQFDHIVEEHIKEAVIRNEPLFEACAWEKMEEKLNDENRKKRYFFVWIVFGVCLLLLMCIPKLIYVNKAPDFSNTSKEKIIKTEVDNHNQLQQASIYLTDDKPLVKRKSNNLTKENIFNFFKKKSDKNKVMDRSSLFFKKSAPQIHKNLIPDFAGISNSDATNSSIVNNDFFKKIILLIPLNEDISYNSKKYIPEIFLLSNSKFNNSEINENPTIKNIKQKDKKSSDFYFVGSTGIDIASVKMFSFKNSLTVFKYGAGVGFQINKNISLQTGFYNSRKRYIAGPRDYKVKRGSYWDMVQLTEVDAACLVYEIPLTLRFNFLKKPSYSLYASAGISSFIMKKEDYYYYYIRYNTPHESAWSYTGNKNLFSILNLNLGLEKKISPVFSLLFEPSISIPLAGIGEGKVKLFSTSFQAGLKYQPLNKVKK